MIQHYLLKSRTLVQVQSQKVSAKTVTVYTYWKGFKPVSQGLEMCKGSPTAIYMLSATLIVCDTLGEPEVVIFQEPAH